MCSIGNFFIWTILTVLFIFYFFLISILSLLFEWLRFEVTQDLNQFDPKLTNETQLLCTFFFFKWKWGTKTLHPIHSHYCFLQYPVIFWISFPQFIDNRQHPHFIINRSGNKSVKPSIIRLELDLSWIFKAWARFIIDFF